MTKSTITRERLQELTAGQSGFNLRTATHEESQELARMALAAMDSEPVAWLAIYHGEVYDEAISITRSVVEAQADRFGWESALTEIIPLYRHARPAPVVPEEIISELEQVRDWILNTLPVPTPLTIPNVRRLTTVIDACRMVNQK